MRKSFDVLSRNPLILGASTMAFALAVSWVADGLNGACLWEWPIDESTCRPEQKWMRIGCAFLIAISALIVLWNAARQLVVLKHLRQGDKVHPHKVLLAAVSTLKHNVVDTDDNKLAIKVASSYLAGNVVLFGNLAQDIEAITQAQKNGAWDRAHWNGQQFLRAIVPHVRSLRHAILLCSPDDDGSFKNRNDYQKLLKYYAPQASVDIDRNPVEFENIMTMTNAFNECIDSVLRKNFKESDVMIDVTGGQKTASIAAALATLSHREIEFQYVLTGKDNEVRGFNVISESRGSLGGA